MSEEHCSSLDIVSLSEVNVNVTEEMQGPPRYAVLLESLIGYKDLSWWEETKTMFTGKDYDKVNVLAGSLLESLSDPEVVELARFFDPPLNYKVISPDKTVVNLHCKSVDIKELTFTQMRYLQAVKTCTDRINALCKLEWIESLHEGSGAVLDMPTAFGHPIKIVVRFVGKIPIKEENGIQFGVELLEQRGHGDSDGCYPTAPECRLFQCSPKCAMFVSMARLLLHDGDKAPDVPVKKQFNVGDRVLAYDAESKPVKGIVKWTGKHHGTPVVGIYSDHTLIDSTRRFGHQICTLDHFIKPSLGHTRLFLPIYYVEKDTDDGVSNTDHQGHCHNTRFAHNNSSYNHQASTSYAEKTKQGNTVYTKKDIEDSQKRNLEVTRFLEQDELERKQKAESEKRRNQQLQMKEQLQIEGEIKGFDDTMLDPGKQQQIMDEIKNKKKESNQNSNEVNTENSAYREQFSVQQGIPQQPIGQSHQPVGQPQRFDQNQHPLGQRQHHLGQSHQSAGHSQYIDHGQYPVSQSTGPSPIQHAGNPMHQNVGLSQHIIGQNLQNTDQSQYPVSREQHMGHGQYPIDQNQQYFGGNQGKGHHFTSQSQQQYVGQGQQPTEQTQCMEKNQFLEGQYPVVQHDQRVISNYASQQYNQQHQPQQPSDYLPNQQQQAGNLPYTTSSGNLYGGGGVGNVPTQQHLPQYNHHPSLHGSHQNGQYAPVQQQSDLNKILRAESGPSVPIDNTRMFHNAQISSQPYGGSAGGGVFQGGMPPGLPPPVDMFNERQVAKQPPYAYESHKLEVGNAVQSGNPPRYGIIRYIGEIPGAIGQIAGVEMEEYVTGATNGSHDGFQYFNCEHGKGLFLRLDALGPDLRFVEHEKQSKVVPNPLGPFYWNENADKETFAMPPVKVVENLHTGIKKGIQGHQNSCYLDSTLFGLFAYSTSFDDLFLKQSPDRIGQTIKRTLLIIVNTLRQQYVIHYDAIMVLRNELDKLEQLKGLKSEEKDPEEFLNLLFKHVLNVDPFLRIKRPFGTDREFFVQLFMEPDENLIPQTEALLCDMFKEQKITFEKHPLRLLLQIPRYGKQFKSFRGVIPSLELDVKTLCDGYAPVAGPCFVCSRPGMLMCEDCGKKELKPTTYYFCQECTTLWHGNPSRQHHKLVLMKSSSDAGSGDAGNDDGRLRLLSVLCIETSHYVCFTRLEGSGINEWIFFDSMAERPDDVHNLPQVTSCTTELNEWVYGTKDLSRYTSKELPTLVRRFVEDAYLCIYVDQDGIMYGGDDGNLF